MAEAVFIPNKAGIEYFCSWEGPIGRKLWQNSAKLETQAKSKVGVRTGTLQGSISRVRTVEKGNLEVTVGSLIRYGGAHHQGAKPHTIRARRVKFLRFTVAGKVVFAKKVNHPGNKPNPYLSSFLREAVRW